MSSCWKCGKQLPEQQTECEYGCGKDSFPTDDQIKQAMRRQDALTVMIDWDKVQSFDDMKELLSIVWGARIYFPLGVPERIKKFLLPKDRQ